MFYLESLEVGQYPQIAGDILYVVELRDKGIKVG
jgi:hypothetical protein